MESYFPEGGGGGGYLLVIGGDDISFQKINILDKIKSWIHHLISDYSTA